MQMSLRTSLKMKVSGGPLVFCIMPSITLEVLETEEEQESMILVGVIAF